MRWVLEFLLGVAFWVALFYYLSEVVELRPGQRPPPLAFGVAFGIATTRAMLYLNRSDRQVLRFVLCHGLAAAAGMTLGFTLFPPPGPL